MYCHACGIKTPDTFCSERCEGYGPQKEIMLRIRLSRTYPRTRPCKQCKQDFQQRTHLNRYCRACVKERSKIRIPKQPKNDIKHEPRLPGEDKPIKPAKKKVCISCGKVYFGKITGNGFCQTCRTANLQMGLESSYTVPSTGENLGQVR